MREQPYTRDIRKEREEAVARFTERALDPFKIERIFPRECYRVFELNLTHSALTEHQMQALQRSMDKWCKTQRYKAGTVRVVRFTSARLEIRAWAIPDEWELSRAIIDQSKGRDIYAPACKSREFRTLQQPWTWIYP